MITIKKFKKIAFMRQQKASQNASPLVFVRTEKTRLSKFKQACHTPFSQMERLPISCLLGVFSLRSLA